MFNVISLRSNSNVFTHCEYTLIMIHRARWPLVADNMVKKFIGSVIQKLYPSSWSPLASAHTPVPLRGTKLRRAWVLNLGNASRLGDARYFSWGRELVSTMIEKTRE